MSDADTMSADEFGDVPIKKLRMETTNRDDKVPYRGTKLLSSESFNHSRGCELDQKQVYGVNNLEPGHHLRYHSLDQDDVQSSSEHSSNVENDNLTEEDNGNISDSSSHASSGDWQSRPPGMMAWVHKQMVSGADPRDILQTLVPSISHLPTEIDDFSLWKLIINLLSEPQRRPKLASINTLPDVVGLIRRAKNILVLTGAGVSVSCGIPDFRSRDGVYGRLAVDFPDLPDPQAMFDISYFMKDPRPFFKFAKEIYPGQFKPSRSHRFIHLLQKTGRLLRNYTQNIDTLEQVAGISRVIQCHGSFATASCLKCHNRVDCEAIRENIFNQTVPHCPKCPSDEDLAIMKPDIVFFGENLGEEFHRQMTKDKDEADLLIVIGSSLKVRPVALIPSSIPDHVPQILINREPLPQVGFDVELLGDGDAIVAEICRRLGSEFSSLAEETNELTQIEVLPDLTTPEKNSSKESNEIKKSRSASRSQSEETKCTSGDSVSQESNGIRCGDVGDKNNNKLTSAHTTESNVQSGMQLSNVDPSRTEKEISSDGKCDCSSDSHQCRRCGGDASEGNNNANGNDSQSATLSDPKANEDADESNMKSLWRSRWKQSISKRLPAGTFYYGGESRYIFPGAEVAPEEEDDSDVSDMDSSPGSPGVNGKSSSDDSEDEELIGPGGLSSTRRNLSTNTCCFSFHRHASHMTPPHNPTHVCDMHNSSNILGSSKESTVGETISKKMGHLPDKDELPVEENPEESDSIASFPGDFSSHLALSNHSPVIVGVPDKQAVPVDHSDVILPDELHNLIAMETSSSHTITPSAPQPHSSLPPDLHEILVSAPLSTENAQLLGRTDVDILDTDQILKIPSSSLLPSLGELGRKDDPNDERSHSDADHKETTSN